MHGRKEKGKKEARQREEKRETTGVKFPVPIMLPKPMLSSSQYVFPKSAFPCMAGKRNGTAKGKNCENATKKGFACLP
jgi:hypothetical protein